MEGKESVLTQSSYPKAKFPDPWLDDHWYYAHDDVLAWFKRCMTSRPTITPAYKSKWTRGATGDDMMSRYPIHPTHEDWVQWFNKWFSQFNGWEEFDWDKALELQSSPTSMTKETEG